MQKAALVLLLLAVPALPGLPGAPVLAQSQPAKPAPAEVAGDWTVTFETPRENTVQMVIRQKGEKLEGYIGTERGEIPLTGTVTGNDMRVVWTVFEGGDKVDMVFSGKVDKEMWEGTARSQFGTGAMWGQRIAKR